MAKMKRFRRGTTMVEAAFVLPILLILTLGTIEYGWLFLQAQQITNAARQGARLAILQDVTETEVRAEIDECLRRASLDDDNPNIEIGVPVQIPGGPPGRMQITVRITVPTETLTIVHASPLLPVPAHLGSTVTMAMEGT
jgi:Flp pilus assembly protein TadG